MAEGAIPRPNFEAIEAAVSGAAQSDPNYLTEWTCRNGLRLTIRRPPPHLMDQILSRLKQPEVPKARIESQGREEENPDDPGYRAAMEQWTIDRSEATAAAALTFGTEVAGELPEGLVGPESDEWIEIVESTVEMAGSTLVVAREPKRRRFYDWLRYYAVGDPEDLYVLTLIAVNAHITEAEVQQGLDTFRHILGRYPTLEGSIFEYDDFDRNPIPTVGPGAGE